MIHEYARIGDLDSLNLTLLVNKVSIPSLVNAIDEKDKYTPLIIASINGYSDIVQFLLEKGAEVNLRAGRLMSSALMKAAEAGHISCITLLLDRGAKLDLKNNFGSTSLMLACEKRKDRAAALLILNRADINLQNNYEYTALMLVAEIGYTPIVKLLCSKKAKLEIKNKYGKTALILAAEKGHLDTVVVLVQSGAHVNAQSKDGVTALMAAACNGHISIVRYFILETNADTLLLTEEGDSALALLAAVRTTGSLTPPIAIEYPPLEPSHNTLLPEKQVELAALLVSQDLTLSYLTHSNKRGDTVFLRAAEAGNVQLLRYLLEDVKTRKLMCKWSIDTANNAGYTALLLAAKQGQLPAVSLLILHGANPNAISNDGESLVSLLMGYLEVYHTSIPPNDEAVTDLTSDIRLLSLLPVILPLLKNPQEIIEAHFPSLLRLLSTQSYGMLSGLLYLYLSLNRVYQSATATAASSLMVDQVQYKHRCHCSLTDRELEEIGSKMRIVEGMIEEVLSTPSIINSPLILSKMFLIDPLDLHPDQQQKGKSHQSMVSLAYCLDNGLLSDCLDLHILPVLVSPPVLGILDRLFRSPLQPPQVTRITTYYDIFQIRSNITTIRTCASYMFILEGTLHLFFFILFAMEFYDDFDEVYDNNGEADDDDIYERGIRYSLLLYLIAKLLFILGKIIAVDWHIVGLLKDTWFRLDVMTAGLKLLAIAYDWWVVEGGRLGDRGGGGDHPLPDDLMRCNYLENQSAATCLSGSGGGGGDRNSSRFEEDDCDVLELVLLGLAMLPWMLSLVKYGVVWFPVWGGWWLQAVTEAEHATRTFLLQFLLLLTLSGGWMYWWFSCDVSYHSFTTSISSLLQSCLILKLGSEAGGGTVDEVKGGRLPGLPVGVGEDSGDMECDRRGVEYWSYGFECILSVLLVMSVSQLLLRLLKATSNSQVYSNDNSFIDTAAITVAAITSTIAEKWAEMKVKLVKQYIHVTEKNPLMMLPPPLNLFTAALTPTHWLYQWNAVRDGDDYLSICGTASDMIVSLLLWIPFTFVEIWLASVHLKSQVSPVHYRRIVLTAVLCFPLVYIIFAIVLLCEIAGLRSRVMPHRRPTSPDDIGGTPRTPMRVRYPTVDTNGTTRGDRSSSSRSSHRRKTSTVGGGGGEGGGTRTESSSYELELGAVKVNLFHTRGSIVTKEDLVFMEFIWSEVFWETFIVGIGMTFSELLYCLVGDLKHRPAYILEADRMKLRELRLKIFWTMRYCFNLLFSNFLLGVAKVVGLVFDVLRLQRYSHKPIFGKAQLYVRISLGNEGDTSSASTTVTTIVKTLPNLSYHTNPIWEINKKIRITLQTASQSTIFANQNTEKISPDTFTDTFYNSNRSITTPLKIEVYDHILNSSEIREAEDQLVAMSTVDFNVWTENGRFDDVIDLYDPLIKTQKVGQIHINMKIEKVSTNVISENNSIDNGIAAMSVGLEGSSRNSDGCPAVSSDVTDSSTLIPLKDTKTDTPLDDSMEINTTATTMTAATAVALNGFHDSDATTQVAVTHPNDDCLTPPPSPLPHVAVLDSPTIAAASSTTAAADNTLAASGSEDAAPDSAEGQGRSTPVPSLPSRDTMRNTTVASKAFSFSLFSEADRRRIFGQFIDMREDGADEQSTVQATHGTSSFSSSVSNATLVQMYRIVFDQLTKVVDGKLTRLREDIQSERVEVVEVANASCGLSKAAPEEERVVEAAATESLQLAAIKKKKGVMFDVNENENSITRNISDNNSSSIDDEGGTRNEIASATSTSADIDVIPPVERVYRFSGSSFLKSKGIWHDAVGEEKKRQQQEEEKKRSAPNYLLKEKLAASKARFRP